MGPRREATVACGGGSGGTQFGRSDRNYGTLCTVYYNSMDPGYVLGKASEVCVTPGGAWAHRSEDVSCKGRIVLGIEMA